MSYSRRYCTFLFNVMRHPDSISAPPPPPPHNLRQFSCPRVMIAHLITDVCDL